jgi:hypothetical protein
MAGRAGHRGAPRPRHDHARGHEGAHRTPRAKPGPRRAGAGGRITRRAGAGEEGAEERETGRLTVGDEGSADGRRQGQGRL